MSIVHPKDLDHEALASDLLVAQPVLRDKIAAALPLALDQVPAMLVEVLRFLHLTAWSRTTLTPAHRIDLAWHEFILFTRAYACFCEQHFGRFIHHQPGGSQEENRLQLRRTLKLYDLCFGPPPPAFWGDQGYFGEASDCGACESD
jgi:hypothetical protein